MTVMPQRCRVGHELAGANVAVRAGGRCRGASVIVSPLGHILAGPELAKHCVQPVVSESAAYRAVLADLRTRSSYPARRLP